VAHGSRWSHLRGTSGFYGNLGQLGLPGITAKAGFTAVISGWRNTGAVCRPRAVAGGASVACEAGGRWELTDTAYDTPARLKRQLQAGTTGPFGLKDLDNNDAGAVGR